MALGVASTFLDVLTQAVKDFTENGFDNIARLQYWMKRIREAAQQSMTPDNVMRAMLNAALRSVYDKLIEQGRVVTMHPGIEQYTISKIRPELRATLDRHIHASADLIKLNKDEMVEKTLRRFSGWATSIPPGGTGKSNRKEVVSDIKRGIAGLKFQERRVIIDQGHKLTAAISNVVAEGGGALGGFWFSHWRQPGYNYREDHKERDGKFWVLRDNWAMNEGYMKLGGHEYTDEQTMPGEEVYCRCLYRYVYNLRDVPDECVTAKGRAKLAEVRAFIAKQDNINT